MSFETYQPSNIFLDENKNKYQDIDIKNDVVTVENGTILVSDSFQESGVYDENGDLCPDSVLLRGNANRPTAIHKNINCENFIDEPVVYLGGSYMFSHFGHFLVEGLARTWALLDKKYSKLKVVIFYETKQKLPSFVRKMLNALGVADENILVIYKTTKFAKVFVPIQAMNGHLYILPIMNKVFDNISSNMSKANYENYDKIYLSRSRMNDGRTFGENSVENIFAKNGYKIIYPETLPLKQQIFLAKNCKEMAGTAGTALHLALFMKRGGRVIQIKRNSTISDNINTQKLICDLRGLDLVWIYGTVETVATDHFTQFPQIIGITKYLTDFFDDNHFVYADKDITPDTVAIKKYLRQIRIYRAHKIYAKVMNTPIKFISLFGISKHGRKNIREYLRKKLRAQY